jgi:hypothetical protein
VCNALLVVHRTLGCRAIGFNPENPSVWLIEDVIEYVVSGGPPASHTRQHTSPNVLYIMPAVLLAST